jgi:hypothetical protein
MFTTWCPFTPWLRNVWDSDVTWRYCCLYVFVYKHEVSDYWRLMTAWMIPLLHLPRIYTEQENEKCVRIAERLTYLHKALKTELNLSYIKTQFVPRSKHTPSQLYKPVS